MTNMLQAEAHVTDADRVRVLDREMDRPEQMRVDAHVAACASCAARLERLQKRSAQLSLLMLESDYDTPATRVPAARNAHVIDLGAARAQRARRMFASPAMRV